MLSALQARIRIVQSPANARVKALRRAIEHPPSPHRRDRGSLLAVEGFHLLAEALRAGLAPEAIFVRHGDEAATVEALLTQAGGARAADALQSADLLALPETLFHSLLETVTPQPVAALLPLPTSGTISPETTPLVLVLCGLQDPGNVGTLLRSAHAFGATAALLVGGTASPWGGKCLRASAGAAFHLPLLAAAGADAARGLLYEHGIRSYAAVPRDGLAPEDSDLATAAALWIGNEGAGLSPAELAACDARITLPMHAGTESLNAAVAGSLLLYEAARIRGASKQP